MGRRATGWRIRQRAPGHAYSVRFSWDGEDYELSTGTPDPRKASGEAARIYAQHVAKPLRRRQKTAPGGAPDLATLLSEWLDDYSAAHDAKTVKVYKGYAEAHWVPYFDVLRNVTEAGVTDYMKARLRKVLAATVRQELVALRNFCGWLEAQGHAGKIVVPRVTNAMLGTKHPKPKRVASPELTPEEITAFLAALPERSGKKLGVDFPVRAKFVVQYETSLRPSTIARLSVPEHYARGRTTLTITRDIDKVRFARRIPLTQAAREALDAICPDSGLIFGEHEYKHWVHKAAKAALPAWKAKLFAGAHLRSARITHTAEATGNLPGVQFMAGHKNIGTTARYVKPSERAANDMLAALDNRETRQK